MLIMKYITGIHALNTPCSLDTTGDWHYSSIDWSNPVVKESSYSFFGDYGIEEHDTQNWGHTFIANHIRALLDYMIDDNMVGPQGMRNDYICNEVYTPLIFEKVYEMRNLTHWDDINRFMIKEYRIDWVNFLKEMKNG